MPRDQEQFIPKNLGEATIRSALRDSGTDDTAIVTEQSSLGPRRGRWTSDGEVRELRDPRKQG